MILKENFLKNLPDNRRWQQDTLPFAFSWLPDISDSKVLEIGCGTGEISILLAKQGPEVLFSMDVYTDNINKVIEFADSNNVSDIIKPVVMQGEYLAFKDNYFDLVFCNMCLHHMNLPLVLPEISRVLKSGGELIFIEPFGDSFIESIPRLIPALEKWAENDSGKFNFSDIDRLRQYFSIIEHREFDIFSRLDRLIHNQRVMGIIRMFDRFILFYFPVLRRFSRFIVVKSVK